MDESEITQVQYASFLVRLWRSDEPQPDEPVGDWQGEVEHIQSGQRWRFASLAGLNRILRQPCGVAETQSPGESR
jgi:hypothetical protein